MKERKPKTESDYHADVERGRRAEAILKDPLIKEYFEEKRQAILYNLATANWRDQDEQQELIRILRLLISFEKDFQRVIRTGDKATDVLKQLLRKDTQYANRQRSY